MAATTLEGRNILIVEDEYLIAVEVAHAFRSVGAQVLGPVGTIDGADTYIDSAEAAVIDIGICGEMSFPLADRLATLGVPFVFHTGYDRDVIPTRFRQVEVFTKPADTAAIVEGVGSKFLETRQASMPGTGATVTPP